MMGFQWFDVVNGAFETLGGWFTWSNAWRLYKDKEIKGFYWPSIYFFGTWGLWNLVFYWQVDAPLSWWGGVILVAGNLWWMWLYVYYRRTLWR